MVERSSTIVMTKLGSPFTASGTDRALGAAVTAGLGVIIVQVASRYIRRLTTENSGTSNADHDGVTESWLESLIDAFKSWMEDERSLTSVDFVVHRGNCHCRSVVFEFNASPVIIAKDGSGKIHYPHVRVKASDFCIVSGGEMLQMYYIAVPANGASPGVTPVTAAFTFCSRCGIHIVHAPSAQSNLLDVNVDCLDTNWKLSKKKENLSHGVSMSTQWDSQESVSTMREFDFASRNHFFPAGPLTALTGADEEDDFHQTTESWVSSTTAPKEIKQQQELMVIPGTPTTVSTVGTDSHNLTAPAQSFEGRDFRPGSDRSVSLGLELPQAATSRLLPPIDTSLSGSEDGLSSTTSSHATPMMRDQLKYYMSKHVSVSDSKKRTLSQKSTKAASSAKADTTTTTTVVTPSN